MIPYVAAEHRFWAISERDGTVYFETSHDGASFASFASMAAPIDLGVVRLVAFSGTNNSVASPGQASFESFGMPATSPVDACPSSTLVDSFDDGALGHRWASSYAEACCSFAESASNLAFTLDGTVGTAAVRSTFGYDLRGDSISVELVQGPAVTGVNAVLVARYEDNTALELIVTSTQTNARELIAGVGSSMTAPRDPAERFLRIAESGGNYVMEVSADRATWRTLRSEPLPFPVDDIVPTLRAGTTSPGPATAIRFDNFNYP
jgi:hypothetical protein